MSAVTRFCEQNGILKRVCGVERKRKTVYNGKNSIESEAILWIK